MTFSKLTQQSIRLLSLAGIAPLVATLVLAGCSVDSKKAKSTAPGDSQDFAMDPDTNFRVDSLAVTSTAVVTWQSNGQFPAKKLFNFSACLKDFNGNAMNPDVPFTVSDANGTEHYLTTYKNGCLNWAETLVLNGLESENMFLLKRTFTAQKFYHGKVYAQGGLNPWADNAASFVDFRTTQIPERIKVLDAKSLDNSGLRIKSAGSAPQIFIDSINFQFLGLDYEKYEVNRFLNLTISQKYRVRLKPQIVRQTLNNEIDLKTINRGKMKVLITLLKDVQGDRLDPKNVITSLEFTGDIILGTLTADINLKIDSQSLPGLLSRSQVVVNVVPMDELADFAESSFQGPSNPGLLAATTLVPTLESARTLALTAATEKVKAMSGRDQITPIQLFAQLSALKPLNTGGSYSYGGTLGLGVQTIKMSDALEKYLDGHMSKDEISSLAKEFCHRIFAGQPLLDNCSSPYSLVSLGYREIVEDVNKTPVWKGETTKETLSLTTKIDFSNGDGWSDSFKWGWSAGLAGDLSLGIGGDLGSTVLDVPKDPADPSSWGGAVKGTTGASLKGTLGGKVSIGQDWYRTKSRSRLTAISETSSRAIDVIGNSFDISAKTRRCIIVGPSSRSTWVANKYKGDMTQLYYCSKTVRSAVHTESYYQLNEKVGDDSTGFSDTGRPGASPWRMFMRGPKTYLLFKSVIQSLKENDLVLEKLPQDSAVRATMEKFPEFYTMQEYPGMLTPQ